MTTMMMTDSGDRGGQGRGNEFDPVDLPTVSILIPVLNDAAGLSRCLDSIRANTYPAALVEIVVADNGSVDASGEVARRAGATVVRLPGVSVAAARNRIAAVASG